MENEVAQQQRMVEHNYELQQHVMTGGYELRQYLEVFVKYWWLIVLGTVLAAVAAWVTSLSMTPTYEATAGVLIAGTRTKITFDPRFQTIDSAGGASYYAAMNQQARRSALVALVENGAIATQVAERLKGELDAEELNPAILLGMVSGTLRETATRSSTQAGSDFIDIKVQSSDPAKAARIANAWAAVYEDYVNKLYGARPESYSSVQRQVTTTRATYEQAESALTAFIAESRIDDLKRRINEKQNLIDDLQSGKSAVSAELAQTDRAMLSQYYATSRELKRLLADARSLQLQIQQSGSSAAATNELALMLLKAEAFASSGSLPANLQLQIGLGGDETPGARSQVADLEALISVVEGRLTELDAAIAEQSQVLLSAGGYDSRASLPAPGGMQKTSVAATQSFDEAMDGLQEEVRQLQVQLAQEEAVQKELIRARDLAWSTYSTLQTKLAELGIAAEMRDVEVSFAAPAVEPVAPTNARTSLNVSLAAVVGLMLATGVAFLLQYLDPEFDPATVTRGLSE